MERKDEQHKPDMPQQPQEKPRPMAKDQDKRKPEHHDDEMEKDNTVGKIDDPEGEHPERKRDGNK